MKRLNKRQLRVNDLLAKGWNMEKNFFALSNLTELEEYRKLDGYNYVSPLGRSVLCSYWYSLQSEYQSMNKDK